MRLNFPVERHSHKHDAEYDYRENRNYHDKNQSGLHVYGKRHDHRAEHDKRGAQEQTQHQIYP